jgi:hypothetical protein
MKRAMLNQFITRYLILWIMAHALVSLLLDNITALAPDENFYVSLFNRSYSVEQDFAQVSSWSNSSGLFIKILYFPAYALHFCGLNSLQSLRFASILASALALILLWMTAKESFRLSKSAKIVFVSLSCIPTSFLWQSLALRESYIFLEFSAVFFLLNKLRVKFKTSYLIFLTVIMTFLLFTKDYLYVVLATSVIIACTYEIVRSKFKTTGQYLLILAVVLPIAIFIPQTKGIIQSSAKISPASDGVSQGAGTDGVSQGAGTDGVSQGAGTDGVSQGAGTDGKGNLLNTDPEQLQIGGGTLHLLNEQLESNRDTFIFKLLDISGIYSQIKESAKSSYSEPSSPKYTQSMSLLSLPTLEDLSLGEITSRAIIFLFVPTPGKDNGSLFLNLQSLEFPFWLLMYMVIGASLFRNFIEKKLQLDILTVYIFIFFFIGISSITEINIGTALRHRSILLIPSMYLLTQLWPQKDKKIRTYGVHTAKRKLEED